LSGIARKATPEDEGTFSLYKEKENDYHKRNYLGKYKKEFQPNP
jgi:hypothetical protein